MKSPIFSVVIPTYNRAYLLRDAIESVLRQTFSDFELIIVDDHSTDNTTELVNGFGDSRIKYCKNNRTKGASGARNVGIFNTHAEWVVFLDSDDVWKPEFLESVYRMIETCEDTVGLIHTGFVWADYNCKAIKPVYKTNRRGDLYQDLLYKNHIGTFSCVAVKTEIARAVGGLDENLSNIEDWDFYIRISKITKIENIPDILVYYRNDFDDNLTKDYVTILKNLMKFKEKYKKEISEYSPLGYRLAFRICRYSFNTNNWKLYFKHLPLTIKAVGRDAHNIFALKKYIAISIKKKYSKLRY